VSEAPARVLGWDLLRGLCALTVALYHLLYWLKVVELPALGTYGVYLFFVLSGASLAYNYGKDRVGTLRGAGRFLLARWLRLAPLYVLLCLVYTAVMAALPGAMRVDVLAQRLLWNVTFAFGFNDPATTAMLIGGWSLGIEFVFYLLYPLLAAMLPYRWASLGLFAFLVAVQFVWIDRTVGTQGWFAAVKAYHQAPAFAAYFFGGCILGALRRRDLRTWPLGAGVLGWFAMALLLAALMPGKPGDELLGLRGAVLFTACFAVVYVSGRVDVKGRLAPVAQWMGDATYGLYLLHPILLFTFLWFVAPGAPGWPLPARLALLLGLIATASVLATLSERYFERRIRRLGRNRSGAEKARQSDAARMSS
jgi:exopolysaccharide production protein ExoZ